MPRIICSLLAATAVCGMFAASPAVAGSADSTYTTTVTNVTATQLTRADVVRIQRSLSDRGYFSGAIDGRWGPETAAAMAAFQTERNVNPDGIPTRESVALLGIELPPSYTVAQGDTPLADIEPAAGGGDGPVVSETVTRQDTYTTTLTGGGIAAVNTVHENGSTCLKCTNGIYGNGSTPSMHSNEY